MKFSKTILPGVVIVEPDIIGDQRGFFFVPYQAKRFIEAGIEANFIQDNHSGSQKGTLRGLHYQIRYSQGKLIRVIAGEIFDVAVDIRQSSPSFGKWVGVRLSADNKKQLWVSKGFAHGFFVITDWAEVVYKVTDIYAPEWERTIAWNDPEIGIEWPIPKGAHPLLSEKDLHGKRLIEADLFE